MKAKNDWHAAGATDIGLVRASNQDAYAVSNDLGLWVIADGMGGHAGGDVASRIAVDTTVQFWQRHRDTSTPVIPEKSPFYIEAQLRATIIACHQAILLEASRDPTLAGMGTTIVILVVTSTPEPTATIAHVGDSRAYLLRAETLTQLTRDHSLVEEQVRKGSISSEEALTHPHRHVLSRALGIAGQFQPDITSHRLEPDDILLLCTDGLTKTLDDILITHTLLHSGPEAEVICRRLIETANARGGPDNTTVIVVRS
jgi:protein phosphatase